MAGLVLMFMVAVMVVVLFFRLVMQKPVKKYLLASSIILGSYLVTVSCACGPNPKDVAVMKPMAEKIADYIVKHGIPKSLEEIPGLPYELECDQSGKKCHYLKDDKYKVELYYAISKQEPVIEFFNKRSKTGIQYWFKLSNGTVTLERKGSAYSTKSSGICNPMKQ